MTNEMKPTVAYILENEANVVLREDDDISRLAVSSTLPAAAVLFAPSSRNFVLMDGTQAQSID
jgi:hypothetical protein